MKDLQLKNYQLTEENGKLYSNAMPTYLNAMVAVGIVLKARCGEAGDAGNGVPLSPLVS